MQVEQSLSLANPSPIHTTMRQKIGLSAVTIGFLMLMVAFFSGPAAFNFSPALFFTLSVTLIIGGAVIFIRDEYIGKPEGIKNNSVYFHTLSSREVLIGLLVSLAPKPLSVILLPFSA